METKTDNHPAVISEKLIAERAYEIYVREGRIGGHAERHWEQAKAELAEEVGINSEDYHGKPNEPHSQDPSLIRGH